MSQTLHDAHDRLPDASGNALPPVPHEPLSPQHKPAPASMIESSSHAVHPQAGPAMADLVIELKRRRAQVELGGGIDKLFEVRDSGRLTARDRIAELLDVDTFIERYGFAHHRSDKFGMAGKFLPADGVVTGAGRVDGRLVHVASQDSTVNGGAVGEVHADKVVEMMQASLSTLSPFVLINDSGGARIQEGIDSLAGYARVFQNHIHLSGIVPQISLICGTCAGGAAYSPALTDFIIQTRSARMFITGPRVLRNVTREEVSAEQLGGPDANMQTSGNIHFIAQDDHHAAAIARRLLTFLPSSRNSLPPRLAWNQAVSRDPAINELLPSDPRRAYDMRTIVRRLLDDADFLEVHAGFAQNIIVGFGRVAGRSVGVVANNPSVRSGALDIDSSDKAARFVRFCNAFNIPILTLVDVPGFLPGLQQEQGGIIRHGAKLLFAYAESTVPKITIVIRKAYGGAYIAMACKGLGTDIVAAWPTAEIAVMGAEAAVDVIFKRELAQADNPAAAREGFIATYRDTFSNPFVAGGRRLVDDIIEPAETRRFIANHLSVLCDTPRLSARTPLIPL